jgi:hypothetical protein
VKKFVVRAYRRTMQFVKTKNQSKQKVKFRNEEQYIKAHPHHLHPNQTQVMQTQIRKKQKMKKKT